MVECHAAVRTALAGKYLRQLCKHFAHKVRSEYDDAAGRVEFPPGLCHMTADADALRFYCQSASPQGLQVMQGIIDSHLQRFAWREDLVLSWGAGLPQDTPANVRSEMAAAPTD